MRANRPVPSHIFSARMCWERPGANSVSLPAPSLHQPLREVSSNRSAGPGDPAPVRSTLNTPGLWARQHHLEQLNLTQGLWVPTFSGTIKGCVSSSLGKRTPVLAKTTAKMSQYFLLWLKLKVGYSSCLHGNLLWICIPSTKLFLDLSMISDPGVNIH